MGRRVLVWLGFVTMIGLVVSAQQLYGKSATQGHAHCYLQPDNVSFSIWGVIYLGFALLCLLGVWDSNLDLKRNAAALSAAFVLNGLWLHVNAHAVEDTSGKGSGSHWSSVAVLLAYLASLASVYAGTVKHYAKANFRTVWFVYAPISLAVAWAVVALGVNFGNTVLRAGVVDFSKQENRTLVGGPDWAIGVLALVVLSAVYAAAERADFVYVVGAAWSLQGVARAQTQGGGFPNNKVHAGLHDFAHQGSVALLVLALLTVARVAVSKSVFGEEEEDKEEEKDALPPPPTASLQA